MGIWEGFSFGAGRGRKDNSGRRRGICNRRFITRTDKKAGGDGRECGGIEQQDLLVDERVDGSILALPVLFQQCDAGYHDYNCNVQNKDETF